MHYKKTTLIIVSILVVIGLSILVAKQKRDTTVVVPTQESKPLSTTDETALQKQLQEIIAKGNESECETLGDARYQFACHDLFKNMKK